MHKYLWLLMAVCSGCVYAQHQVEGTVWDEFSEPLPYATLNLGIHNTQANEQGIFHFDDIPEGSFTLTIFSEGTQIYQSEIKVPTTGRLDIFLTSQADELDEIIIHTTHAKTFNEAVVGHQHIIENFAGSLASSLTQVAGVQSSDIGSGNSKPIIRGLGFNRVAVSENGIKQEGQQWGADHGLEIDALQTEKVEIIKGVGAIAYGGDAIGGVIQIQNDAIPAKEGFSGNIILHGQSVNDGLGLSASSAYKSENHFLKAKFSMQDYADFKIPTDQIRYLNTNIPVDNRRLKNTAGRDQSVYLQGGFFNEKFKNILSLSYVGSKTGFFPGAHGVPSIDSARQDGDFRDIDFPFQQVNHIKAINQSEWYDGNRTWSLTVGLQHNHRQEWSAFHTHYGNQPKPNNQPDLELDFKLITADIQGKVTIEQGVYHQTQIGLQHNYQVNRVGGYGFLLPEYDRANAGLFAQHHWDISAQWQLDVGWRLDYTEMDIAAFFDPILYEHFVGRGYLPTEATDLAQRSAALQQSYLQQNVAIGARYRINDDWAARATFSTNFRTPTAIELSANGVHHGAFRHEKGNPNLSPEKGFSAETGISWEKNDWSIDWNPYVYYFQNYIYLKPSGKFSPLPHAGQVYEYDESKALLYGFEFVASKKFNNWQLQGTFEYLNNRQIVDGKLDYPLPFTPPINAYSMVEYTFKDLKSFKNTSAQASIRWANQQSEIARNEDITPSYTTFGLLLKTQWHANNFKPSIQLAVNNLFNTKYYNHASFYRAVEIPELGRNIQLIIQIPIN